MIKNAYTNDQRLLDAIHKDLRCALAAAMNIIPTTTGAARTLALVIPDLVGKVDGLALRVPTATVSVVDFVATLKEPASRDAVNHASKQAAAGNLKAFCFRLRPDVMISLGACAKVQGEAMKGEAVELVAHHHPGDEMASYERLLGDAIRGDPELFVREDAASAAWTVVDAVLGVEIVFHNFLLQLFHSEATIAALLHFS